MVMSLDGQTSANLGAFTIDDQTGGSLLWDWSVASLGHGWDGWSHDAPCSGTTCSEYGPAIESGHGVYGLTAISTGAPTQYSVTKTFTAPTGIKWRTITFNGQLSTSSDASVRWMDIWVNGARVFDHNTQPLPNEGQPFTITESFPLANSAIVMISSGQDPTLDTQYTMQFDSLTLS